MGNVDVLCLSRVSQVFSPICLYLDKKEEKKDHEKQHTVRIKLKKRKKNYDFWIAVFNWPAACSPRTCFKTLITSFIVSLLYVFSSLGLSPPLGPSLRRSSSSGGCTATDLVRSVFSRPMHCQCGCQCRIDPLSLQGKEDGDEKKNTILTMISGKTAFFSFLFLVFLVMSRFFLPYVVRFLFF